MCNTHIQVCTRLMCDDSDSPLFSHRLIPLAVSRVQTCTWRSFSFTRLGSRLRRVPYDLVLLFSVHRVFFEFPEETLEIPSYALVLAKYDFLVFKDAYPEIPWQFHVLPGEGHPFGAEFGVTT